MNHKSGLQQVYILSAFICWVVLLLTDNWFLLFSEPLTNTFATNLISDVIFSLFILSSFLFYKINVGTFESEGFNDLLWRTSITGFSVIIIITCNNLLLTFLTATFPEYSPIIRSVSYHVVIATTIIFVCSCFFVFKRMILYQKSKEVFNLWKVFESLVYITIAFSLFNLDFTQVLFQLSLIPLIVMGVILSFNLKWIAYLNVKQKLSTIIYFAILLCLTIILLWNLFQYSDESKPYTDLVNNLFTISLLSFVSCYCIFSLLVLVFNLPTSSVFEKKFEEILNFQKLSKSVQVGKTEEEVYKTLVDSCMATLMSTTACLIIYDEFQKQKKVIYRNLDKERLSEIESVLRRNSRKIGEDYLLIEDMRKEKYFEEIDYMGILSLLAIPLNSYNEKLGVLYLFSEIKHGFEREMIDLVTTYVNQASTSISNFRLINQAVKNARYVEELAIAKKVQASLLPNKFINNEYLHMAAASISADEVGGDYFDFTELSEKKYCVVIGDVSGKGTSAAFHMAKMKGIYHTLVQLNLPTDKFLKYANTALSASLERGSFITLTIMVIDLENRTIETSRAGHCPTLYFNHLTRQCEFIEQKGLGLGILRNEWYIHEVSRQVLHINNGDIIVLYTDGIVEAVNEDQEQFGYDRIKTFFNENYLMEPEQLKERFLEEIHKFCGSVALDDDYSVMIIKVK